MDRRRGGSGPRRAAVAALLSLGLAGCVGAPSVQPPAPPASSEGPGCRRTPPADGTMTVPGATLCLGTPAVLPVQDAEGRSAVVQVAVTGFAEVPDAELARFRARLDEDLPDDLDTDEVTVYTLTADARLLTAPADRGAGGIEPLGLAGLVTAAESATINVLRRWSPRGCRARFFAAGDPVGSRLATCAWFTVELDDEVTAARVGSDVGDYDPLTGQPVVWVADRP